MLETRLLLLFPPAGVQPRPIFDGESGGPLGFALWRDKRERSWWKCRRGPVLSIHEQEESPLLFTVRRRGWLWPRQEVRDAEGERVGSFAGCYLRDRNRLLYAQARPADQAVVYESILGETLAWTQPTPKGLELHFEKLIETEPFAKMLLLAAALFQG